METVLETESAGRKIWVVKVPPPVAKRWREVCDNTSQNEMETGPKLGTIIYTTTEAGPKFQPNLDNEATADLLAQEYEMQPVTQNAPTMLAFQDKGRRFSAEGIAQQRFDVEPSRSNGNNLKAGLVSKATLSKQKDAGVEKARSIQVMSEPKYTNIRKPIAGLVNLGGPKKKTTNEKRIAKPVEELQSDLFRLFEKQSRWAFVQLQKETDQPTQHLKSVLSEIALQDKRGPYKDPWELKREFKTSTGA